MPLDSVLCDILKLGPLEMYQRTRRHAHALERLFSCVDTGRPKPQNITDRGALFCKNRLKPIRYDT